MGEAFGVLKGKNAFLCRRDVNAQTYKAVSGSQSPTWSPVIPVLLVSMSLSSPISHRITIGLCVQ